MEENCEGAMKPDNNSTEGNRKRKETAGRISSAEDMDTAIEIKVEHATEEEETSKQLMIRPGTQFLAKHEYKNNPDSGVENGLDLNEGDTVVYLMKHYENERFWLVEDGKGHVPVAYLMIIIYETVQEEESDTTRKEGHEKMTDGTKIGGET